ANCTSDSDCYNPAPYCSSTLNTCVECKTDANCGNKGIKCKDGICGSCGDGICSDNERAGQFGVCKDCVVGCPKGNLGTKLGDPIAKGTTTASDAFPTTCGSGFGNPGTGDNGATFQWTAPSTGSFLISSFGSGAFVAVLADDCAGAAY